MSSYQRRIEFLADAMRVRPDQVIQTLRRKNLHYCNAQGVILFDGTAWTDERLLDAAFALFIEADGETEAPAPLQ